MQWSHVHEGCPGRSKHPPASAGDADLIPGSGSSPEEGKSNPLQDSCLGNPMDREAWWATIHGLVKESDTTWGLKKINCYFTIRIKKYMPRTYLFTYTLVITGFIKLFKIFN